MIDVMTAPYGALILRLCLGVMFIAHAMLKLRVYKILGTIAYFKSLGLPGWLAYITIAVELSGGICLILGIFPRYVALILIPLIVGVSAGDKIPQWSGRVFRLRRNNNPAAIAFCSNQRRAGDEERGAIWTGSLCGPD